MQHVNTDDIKSVYWQSGKNQKKHDGCEKILIHLYVLYWFLKVWFGLWSLMGSKHGSKTWHGFGVMKLANLWLCCASDSDSGRRRRLRASLRRLFSPNCCPSWPALLRVLQRSTLWPHRPPSTLPRWAKSLCLVRRARVCLMLQLHCCCSFFMNGGRPIKPLLPQY